MAAVLYSIGTSELTLVDWAAGIVGGVAGYTAVLLLMGELTVAELTAVIARLRDVAGGERPRGAL